MEGAVQAFLMDKGGVCDDECISNVKFNLGWLVSDGTPELHLGWLVLAVLFFASYSLTVRILIQAAPDGLGSLPPVLVSKDVNV